MDWSWLVLPGALLATSIAYLALKMRYRRVLCVVVKRERGYECENEKTSWTTAVLKENNGIHEHTISELTREIKGLEFLEEGNCVWYYYWDQVVKPVSAQVPNDMA